MSTSTSASPPDPPPNPQPSDPPLPKLTPAEFTQYNRLADLMDRYHNHFRHQWTQMHAACTANKRPAGMSIRQFLALVENFTSTLTLHHDIEEAHFFPVLGTKMDCFRVGEIMKAQHKEIHGGLEKLEKYTGECRAGRRELRMSEVLEVMDSFGEVLWTHLDLEVKNLGAENMRRYWSLEEMRSRFPF